MGSMFILLYTWFSRMRRSSSSTLREYLYQYSSVNSSPRGGSGIWRKCSLIGDERLSGGPLNASVERVTSVLVSTYITE